MRKLILKINDKDYTLQLNREAIKWLEANGFSLEKMEDKFLTYYDMLWTSLFIANHRDVNPNLALKLQESYVAAKGNKMLSKVIAFAIEEYKAFILALADTDSTTDEELQIVEM